MVRHGTTLRFFIFGSTSIRSGFGVTMGVDTISVPDHVVQSPLDRVNQKLLLNIVTVPVDHACIRRVET